MDREFFDSLLTPEQRAKQPAPFSVSVVLGSRCQAWEDDWRAEATRNLREVADKIERGTINPGDDFYLRDVNGNTIGCGGVRK